MKKNFFASILFFTTLIFAQINENERRELTGIFEVNLGDSPEMVFAKMNERGWKFDHMPSLPKFKSTTNKKKLAEQDRAIAAAQQKISNFIKQKLEIQTGFFSMCNYNGTYAKMEIKKGIDFYFYKGKLYKILMDKIKGDSETFDKTIKWIVQNYNLSLLEKRVEHYKKEFFDEHIYEYTSANGNSMIFHIYENYYDVYLDLLLVIETGSSTNKSIHYSLKIEIIDPRLQDMKLAEEKAKREENEQRQMDENRKLDEELRGGVVDDL